ncbi:centrosomal protein of 131 kDa-like [Xiphophorus couchianus]|uniref:centrosomal protein of 131 kDa-like n=1 Tax=Xiphophorus couchianus TaxID=32473 RepID=UPI001016CF34|nr:centrosomal protein of 131 kDa-like [Xiphophorus couchianus]
MLVMSSSLFFICSKLLPSCHLLATPLTSSEVRKALSKSRLILFADQDMSYQRPQYSNSGSRSQPRSQSRAWRAGQHQQGWNENRTSANELQREVQRLGSLLEMERARWFQEKQKVVSLENELKVTKSELEKQKNLKEVFINKGKEIKRTLLAVEKFTVPETLSPDVVASNVHGEIRRKKKKLLQQEFEQLQATHTASKETFMSQIRAEKEKSDALQQELNQVKTQYEELRSKYEADVREGKLQVDAEMFYEEKLKQTQKLFENLRAEKDDLREQMSKEIACLQKTEKSLQSELEEIKVSFQDLKATYERDVSALREEAQIFKEGADKEIKALSQKTMRDLKIINELGAEKDNLQKQLSALQQMYSTCELNYQTELRDREEVGPRRRKVARRQVRNKNETTAVNNISDPASMDLDRLLEETLSKDFEIPDASPEELNDFIEEMLRDSGILYPNPMEVTNLCVKTQVRKNRKPKS